MAITTTGNLLTTGSLDSIVERQALRNYKSTKFFLNFAMTKVVGQYYNSVTFYTPKDMTGSTAAVTE